MTKLPQEELISAYLDGELTAEQKARAEKLLAEDPSARATLEDLREVSSAVRDLPAFTLDENLAADVLKAAERRMLSEDAPSTVADKSADPPWRTVARRFLTPRSIAWSAAAAMVAIMLIYNNPDQDKPGPRGEIAMKADEKRGADDRMPTRGPGEFRAAPSIGAPATEADSMHAASRPADAKAEEFKASRPLVGKAAPKGVAMPAPPAAKPSIAKSSAVDRLPKEAIAKPAMKSAPKKAMSQPPRKSVLDYAKKPAAKSKKADAKRLDTNRSSTAKGDSLEAKQQEMSGMGMGGMGMGMEGGMGGGMNRNGPGMGGPGMGMGGGMGKGGPGMGMEGGMKGPGMGMRMPLAEKAEEGQIRRKTANNARSAKRHVDSKSDARGMRSAGEPQIITVRCRVDSRPAAQKALRRILLAQKLLPSKPATDIAQDEETSASRARKFGEKTRKGATAGQAKDEDAQDQDKLAPAKTPKPVSEPDPAFAVRKPEPQSSKPRTPG
ncbi:MAG: hypothetical protein U9N87_01165, partial [Planctomycetota bacterium]|nr:hypothetical protein [Planctomycetota bacterium]